MHSPLNYSNISYYTYQMYLGKEHPWYLGAYVVHIFRYITFSATNIACSGNDVSYFYSFPHFPTFCESNS